LLPLIDADTKRAVEQATAVVEPFITQFDAEFLIRLRRKLGLTGAEEGDAALAAALLQAMQAAAADFTLTFRALADALEPAGEQALRDCFRDPVPLDTWLVAWRERLNRQLPSPQRRTAMQRVNPAYIARNHRVEAALITATDGDLQPFHALLRLLQTPFDEHPDSMQFRLPARAEERVLQTFCGT
jgi:uncharacterized protein YdiU (UPF0061 family)